jgi:hypothetical protein
MQRETTIRVLVASAVVVLVGTSLLHLFAGYPAISGALLGTNLKPSVVAVFQTLWVVPSAHWLVAAGFASMAAFRPVGDGRVWVLAFAATLPAIDGLGLLVRVGIFAGDLLLLVASVLLIVAAALCRQTKSQATGGRGIRLRV